MQTLQGPMIEEYQVIIDQFPDWLAGQLGQSSIKMYRRDVREYQKYATRTGKNALQPRTLAQWRDEMALQSQLSPNTINRMLSAVKRTIKQAWKNEALPLDTWLAFHAVEGVKIKALRDRLKKNTRTRITPAQMRRLCESPTGDGLVAVRDRALLATLASSGLRASELVSLMPGQIRAQDDGYMVSVMGKTDIEPRDAHVSAEAFRLIGAWLAIRPVSSEYIFTGFTGRGDGRAVGTPISEPSLWRIVAKYAEQCELSHIKPHDFRRFVGTRLAARDIRLAQKALGHKRIETTASAYVLDQLRPGETDDLY